MIINRKLRNLASITALTLVVSTYFLYHYHESATTNIKQLWVQYKFKSVDEYRIAHYGPDDLRRNLSDAFPYIKSTEPIPYNIWQMWETDNVTSLDPNLQNIIATWDNQPNFTHKIIPNDNFVEFVDELYGEEIPGVVEAFKKMPHIILKSDLIRYLVLLAKGGVYSDIDTALNTNMTDWLSYNNTLVEEDNNKVGLVVGIESDRDQKDWKQNGMPRRVQICQWTLQAKAGHPFYRELVYRIVDLALNHFNPETKIMTKNGKHYDFNKGSETYFQGVLEWTGPAMFTDTLFDYLNDVYKTSEALEPTLDFYHERMVDKNRRLRIQKTIKYERLHGNTNHNDYIPGERPVGWQNITRIQYPILFDEDVLILPRIHFFGKKHDADDYVEHFFKGTWKNN